MGLFSRKGKTVQYSTEQLLTYFQSGRFMGDGKSVSDAFGQIPIVFACVDSKAKTLARVPLRIYKGDKVVESGPAVSLLKRPNPEMSIGDLVYWMVAAINLRGTGYGYWDEIRGGLPEYIVPATDVKPILSGGWVDHYEIQRGNKTIKRDPEFVLKVKYYSHRSAIEGAAPLATLRQKVELAWAADKYNQSFFKNDATPTTLFKSDNRLSPQDLDKLKHSLIDRRKGSRESMVLQGGISVEQLGMSQKDADFVNLYKLSREEICSVFGVPESEINIFTETKYSNAITASSAYWDKTLIPEGEIIAHSITRQILEPLGLECWFDFDSVDAIAKKGFGERVDQAVKLIGVGFSVNEVNERLELGFDTDVDRTPPVQPQPQELKAIEPPNKKAFEAFEHAQAQKWHRMIKGVDSLEAKMRKALKDYYHGVEKKILSTIGDGKGSSWAVKKSFDEGDVMAAFSDEGLAAATKDIIDKAISSGSLAIAGAEIDAGAALEMVGAHIEKIKTTNVTARKEVLEKLREVLNESMEAGDGAYETAKKIKAAVGDAITQRRNHAETIARTEIGGAYNQAGHKTCEDLGMIGVRWISSRDGAVRDSHVANDGQVVERNQTFIGGLRYPQDPDGPASEVINCRCMFEPLYDEVDIVEARERAGG